MSPRLQFAIDAARRAGMATLPHFRGGAAVRYKANDTPVTEADLQAEAMLRQAIRSAYPGEAIFGEEEGGDPNADTRWVIDPIDGTKSFICGVPLYATLLSYEEAGVPVVGVCYLPALDELVYAERGGGAFHNGQPCHVSQRADWSHATVCCAGHRSMEATGLARPVAELAKRCLATRTWCDAYGHFLVATGRVEAMVDPILEPYDISAVSLIVEEAGGRCTDLAGNPWPKGGAVSSNGALHAKLLEALT